MARPRVGRDNAPVGDQIDAAAAARGMSLLDVADGIGLSREGLRLIRIGQSDPGQRTRRNLERALGWEVGGFDTAARGERPAPRVDVDEVLNRPTYERPATAPEEALRRLRKQMGEAAFWYEVGLMQGEKSTERDATTG